MVDVKLRRDLRTFSLLWVCVFTTPYRMWAFKKGCFRAAVSLLSVCLLHDFSCGVQRKYIYFVWFGFCYAIC